MSLRLQLLFTLTLAVATPAQQFVELRRDNLPPTTNRTGSTYATDFDLDGAADLVVFANAAFDLLHNNGDGVFTRVATQFASLASQPPIGDYSTVLPVDLDGTAGIELVAFHASGDLHVYPLSPTGQPAAPYTIAVPNGPSSNATDMVAADFDGDGDLDLFWLSTWANYANTLVLLGPGGATDVSATHLPGGRQSSPPGVMSQIHQEVHAADLDGDGNVDLIGPSFLLWNGGGAMMSDGTAALPALPYTPHSVIPEDLDGDGDLDLTYATVDAGSVHVDVFVNTGGQTFAAGPSFVAGTWTAGTPPSLPIQAIDLDGDALPELIVSTADGIQVHHNGGAITFGTGVPQTDITDVRFPSHTLDLDGDGDLDLLCALVGNRSTVLVRNNGNLTLSVVNSPAVASPTSFSYLAPALGDTNGDGLADMDYATNDGTGRFLARDPAPLGEGYSMQPTVHDLDGDGLADLAGFDGPFINAPAIWWSTPSGAFTAPTWLNGSGPAIGRYAVADLNGDGLPDLVTGGGWSLHFNQGNRTFSSQWLPGFRPYNRAGDLDGDGTQDIVTTDWTGTLAYLNDGTGQLTATVLPPEAAIGWDAIELADVDGDSDLDIYAAGANTPGTPDMIWLNDGTGVFSTPPQPLLPPQPAGAWQAAAGDLDEDGDIDFVISTRFPWTLRVLRNDGTGQFADEDVDPAFVRFWTSTGPGGLPWIELGDTDGDGDLDLVIADGVVRRVFVNRHRHLRAPLALRVGVPFELQVHSEPGSPAPRVAAIGLSTGLLPSPLTVPGFGTVRIDPAAMAITGALVVPLAGQFNYVLPVPANGALLGFELHAQAVVIGPSIGITNLVSERMGS